MEWVTARLRLDRLQADDAAALFACRADPAVARFQGWYPDNIDEVRQFIAAQSPAAVPTGWFQRAIRWRADGTLIGDLGLNLPADHHAAVEFGISLLPAWQRRGCAAEALRAVFDEVFGELARHRIVASVDPRNTACVGLLRTLGLREEAHHRQSLWWRGQWVDDVIFAMLADEWRPSARAPAARK